MAKVEKYRKLPGGFSTLLNKMLRAVLVSRPLEAVRFFADYLEAEINRRTLCDLQLRQPCPSGAVQPTDPWVQYMSFVTIQRAIESLLSEEQRDTGAGQTASYDWLQDDQGHVKVALSKCQGSSATRRRISHRPFAWPPVVKATARCRLRIDRYGPIVKTLSITHRAIRRYVTDEEAPTVVDRCRRRRPIANFWRQILRDCSVKADQWNRKSEPPRRRRRSSPLAELTSSGEYEDGGEKGSVAGGSGSSIDPYLEPKRRRKARNDEGLAKIIYRELGVQPRPAKGECPPSSQVDDTLPPGKASKAVQVEIVTSALHPRPTSIPPPAACVSAIADDVIPIVELMDKAVQVDFDEDESTDDRSSLYPLPDEPLGESLTCPPSPMYTPLSIDWKSFALPTPPPPRPWTAPDINWITEEVEEDGEDAPAIQAKASPPAEPLPDEVKRFVDLDLPAASTVADVPADPQLLDERDDPAGPTLADLPEQPFDLERDDPTPSAAADLPAEPMADGKDSEAQLMNLDEVDDPFSE